MDLPGRHGLDQHPEDRDGRPLTGVQTADGAAVTSQDFTDTLVSAASRRSPARRTSRSSSSSSPPAIVDQAILEDLTADYNMQVDRQVLTGTGANGQITGPAAGHELVGNTVTWTSSTPPRPGLQRGAERGRRRRRATTGTASRTSRPSCTRAAVLVRLRARRRVRHQSAARS
jgi:hypothetical protein